MTGDVEHLVGTFREQAAGCRSLGSPMYEQLLTTMADDIDAGGLVRDVLRGHEGDPGPSALALRLLGGLHRLVLIGDAPALERYYPSTGGTWRHDDAWPVVLQTLDECRDRLRASLWRAPQTNEVGRSAALLGGLLRVVEQLGRPLPVRLWEIGSSAGLNLHADRYRYEFDGGAWGPADSALVLRDAWRGPLPPIDTPLTVAERRGSDRSPIDVSTPDGRVTVSSYVWPDQTERFDRLQAALRVAADVPAQVLEQDAVDAAGDLDLVEGRLTVLWHSVMWQYLDQGAQRTIADAVDGLGARAGDEAPFAHLFLEPTRRGPGLRHEFLVVATLWPSGATWPAGERQVLAVAAPHGLPTTWEKQ